jgi:hypothetical protein
MSEVSFSDVVAEHLELQRRNRDLERRMPLERYREPVPEDLRAADPPTEPLTVFEQLERDPGSWWEEQQGAASRFDWE